MKNREKTRKDRSERVPYASTFCRSIDIQSIPVCRILGVEIAAINMEWLLQFIRANLTKLSGDYICVSNVHTTITASEEETYRRIQNGGVLAIPDGGPLSSVGRAKGFKEMARTAGPDVMDMIFRVSAQEGWTHYFYGSTEETIEALGPALQEKYPGIRIVGMVSPPFRTLSEEEDQVIIENINREHPDFVWVGLGAPKQERWMAEHQGKVEGLMIGVGAGFNFFAGNLSRAPKWMQKSNLEWLYRLSQEPRRLFKRYLYTNSMFVWKAIILGK